MDKQLIDSGTVTGFVPNRPDWVTLDGGFFVIQAYVPFSTPVNIGDSYTVYMHGSTYMLGTRIVAE